ncbi:unnamed protein product, partial [Tilletia caries]
MTIQWLDRLSLAADSKDAAEVAVVAAAATGFWGLCRLGELVSSTDKAQQFHNITRAQATESKVFGGVPTMALNLPRTKTHAQGDTVVIAHQKEECDPIRLLRLHLQQSPCASKEAEKSTPLFAYRDKESLTPLTRTKFISTIGAIGKRAGLGPLHGHSMRIGGCTALLTRGYFPPNGHLPPSLQQPTKMGQRHRPVKTCRRAREDVRRPFALQTMGDANNRSTESGDVRPSGQAMQRESGPHNA